MEVDHKDRVPYRPAAVNNVLSGFYHCNIFVAPSSGIFPKFMNTKNPSFEDADGLWSYRDKVSNICSEFYNRQLHIYSVARD